MRTYRIYDICANLACIGCKHKYLFQWLKQWHLGTFKILVDPGSSFII